MVYSLRYGVGMQRIDSNLDFQVGKARIRNIKSDVAYDENGISTCWASNALKALEAIEFDLKYRGYEKYIFAEKPYDNGVVVLGCGVKDANV